MQSIACLIYAKALTTPASCRRIILLSGRVSENLRAHTPSHMCRSIEPNHGLARWPTQRPQRCVFFSTVTYRLCFERQSHRPSSYRTMRQHGKGNAPVRTAVVYYMPLVCHAAPAHVRETASSQVVRKPSGRANKMRLQSAKRGTRLHR